MSDQSMGSRSAVHGPERFVVNVASNVGLLILNFAVGILFTPYLIGVLGVAVFGVATLAASVASYMAIFDSAINNAIGRFLTIELRQGDYERAGRTFNSALGLAAAVALLMLPAIVAVSWFSPRLFDVPAGYEADARWVFLAALLSYALILMRSVFTSASFANNRLDLLNGTLASGILVRVLVTVLLLSLAAVPRLTHIGTGILIGTVTSLAIAVAVFRRLIPQLHISPRQFDRAQLAMLFSVSSWVFINQLGSVLFLSIDQIIVNTALGSVVQGFYASALQWSILLRTLASALSSALAPIMVRLYAQGETTRLAETSISSVRLLGVVMALPIGLVAGLGQPLLGVWLGPEYERLALLLAVLVLPLSINLAVLPLFPLQVTYNRVKVPGIISLLSGLLNAALALWWVRLDGTGLGVALASALVLTLKNALFTPLYAAHFQHLPRFAYLSSLLVAAAAAGLVAAAARLVAVTFDISNWLTLLAWAAAGSLVYVFLAYLVALRENEREIVRRMLGHFRR